MPDEINPRIARRVFNAWVEATRRNPNRCKLTAARRNRINARLAEGYDEGTLVTAIQGNQQSPWHQGDNPGGTVWDDLDIICRSGAHVERFSRLAEGQGRAPDKAAIVRTEAQDQQAARFQQDKDEAVPCPPEVAEKLAAVRRKLGGRA